MRAGGLLNLAVNSQDSIIGHKTLRRESPEEISQSPIICFGVSTAGLGRRRGLGVGKPSYLCHCEKKRKKIYRGPLAEKHVCRNSAASSVSDELRSGQQVKTADEYAGVASAC